MKQIITQKSDILTLDGNPRGGQLKKDNVYYLIVHCSASNANSDYTPEQMECDHRKRGFYTIGYHFYIRKDGTITQHRYLNEVGAHCRNFNSYSIGICYEGGYDARWQPTDTRTAQQKDAMGRLIGWLREVFDRAKVVGHRDMPGVNKHCPCFEAELEYN